MHWPCCIQSDRARFRGGPINTQLLTAPISHHTFHTTLCTMMWNHYFRIKSDEENFFRFSIFPTHTIAHCGCFLLVFSFFLTEMYSFWWRVCWFMHDTVIRIPTQCCSTLLLIMTLNRSELANWWIDGGNCFWLRFIYFFARFRLQSLDYPLMAFFRNSYPQSPAPRH